MCLAVPGRIESLEDRDGTTMSIVNFGESAKRYASSTFPAPRSESTSLSTSASQFRGSTRNQHNAHLRSSSTSACSTRNSATDLLAQQRLWESIRRRINHEVSGRILRP